MRVIRSILVVLLFLVGVFVANANMHSVDLTYLPSAPALGFTGGATISVPLFLVVLVTLAVGVLLGGLVAILEQAQLRLGLRRARKERDRAVEEEGKAVVLLETANEAAAGLRAEIAELREELRKAGEVEVAEEPLTAFLDSPPAQAAAFGSDALPSQSSADRPGTPSEQSRSDSTPAPNKTPGASRAR